MTTSLIPLATASSADSQRIEPERHRFEAPDSLSLYLREVGQVALLTPIEEVALARRIKKGDGQARDRMIRANLRLVVKIAREFEDYGLPLLDLINEGNIGLMRAVEKFDPDKGAKLSTYSSWWIKQAMRRGIANQAKTVRLPVHVLAKLGQVRQTAAKLTEEWGRDPTDEEIAAELGIPAKRITRLRQTSVGTASLDAPMGDDESRRPGDVIADEAAENPYQELERKTMLALLGKLLARLPERERKILQLRFGLEDGDRHSLEAVGLVFKVTRERIRQLQNLALVQLRRMLQAHESLRLAA